MPDLESHWFAERLAYLSRSLSGDAMWRRKASQTFARLQSDPKAEGRRKTVSFHLVDEKKRGQPKRGIFFLGFAFSFYCISGFFSHSHLIIFL